MRESLRDCHPSIDIKEVIPILDKTDDSNVSPVQKRKAEVDPAQQQHRPPSWSAKPPPPPNKPTHISAPSSHKPTNGDASISNGGGGAHGDNRNSYPSHPPQSQYPPRALFPQHSMDGGGSNKEFANRQTKLTEEMTRHVQGGRDNQSTPTPTNRLRRMYDEQTVNGEPSSVSDVAVNNYP